MPYDGKLCISKVANIQPSSNYKTRKMVPLQGERAHSLYFFCTNTIFYLQYFAHFIHL